MPTKKKKSPVKSKTVAKKKATPKKKAAKKQAAKKKSPAKKAAQKQPLANKSLPKKKVTAKKTAPKKRQAPKKRRVWNQREALEAETSETLGLAARSAGQSGSLQGLSDVAEADSESVDELLEEGNSFEAEAVAGVENVPDADEGEVRTHEVLEDDVPEEYLDPSDQT